MEKNVFKYQVFCIDISEVVDKQWNKQKYISHRDISLRRKEMMYTGELIRWFISNVGEKLSLVHEHRETRVSREKNISRENCSLAEKRVARTSGVGSGIIGLGKNVLETGSVILLGKEERDWKIRESSWIFEKSLFVIYQWEIGGLKS